MQIQVLWITSVDPNFLLLPMRYIIFITISYNIITKTSQCLGYPALMWGREASHHQQPKSLCGGRTRPGVGLLQLSIHGLCIHFFWWKYQSMCIYIHIYIIIYIHTYIYTYIYIYIYIYIYHIFKACTDIYIDSYAEICRYVFVCVHMIYYTVIRGDTGYVQAFRDGMNPYP